MITRTQCKDLVDQMVNGTLEPNWELERKWKGNGESVDLAALAAGVKDLEAEFVDKDDRVDAESLEGKFSGVVHKALRDFPISALDDPGFWRYLSLSEFWKFISLREAKAMERGNIMTYVDGGRECVPFRMFLRGQAIRDGDDYELAGAIPKSTDFWRSHILRVQTGTAPPLARAFAQLQSEERMVSDEVRPFAKKVNRLWTNVVFNVWDEDESDALLRQLYEE